MWHQAQASTFNNDNIIALCSQYYSFLYKGCMVYSNLQLISIRRLAYARVIKGNVHCNVNLLCFLTCLYVLKTYVITIVSIGHPKLR